MIETLMIALVILTLHVCWGIKTHVCLLNSFNNQLILQSI